MDRKLILIPLFSLLCGTLLAQPAQGPQTTQEAQPKAEDCTGQEPDGEAAQILSMWDCPPDYTLACSRNEDGTNWYYRCQNSKGEYRGTQVWLQRDGKRADSLQFVYPVEEGKLRLPLDENLLRPMERALTSVAGHVPRQYTAYMLEQKMFPQKEAFICIRCKSEDEKEPEKRVYFDLNGQHLRTE